MEPSVPDPTDIGLTHVALPIRNAEATASFYARYAGLKVVHRRVDAGTTVIWLADGVRPFVLVGIEHEHVAPVLAGAYAHFGVGCRDRADLDARVGLAATDGIAVDGPFDSGPPVGYWAILHDPDGHQLELSVGQAISAAINGASE